MDIDTILNHYLIAAIWADMPEDDSKSVIADTDIHSDSVAACRREVAAFIELAENHANGDLIEQYKSCEFGEYEAAAAEMLGHDIWLTRNGHGAGFWSRDNLPGTLGDDLTEIANVIGPRNVYRGDDGKVYIS